MVLLGRIRYDISVRCILITSLTIVLFSGIPAIIVGTSAAINHNGYGTDS